MKYDELLQSLEEKSWVVKYSKGRANGHCALSIPQI